MSIKPCDQDVFDNGQSVCLVNIPKETAEEICRNLSAATGCKIDWHYFGGRVHIKALAAPVVERQEPVAYRYKESHASWEHEKLWEPTTLAHGAVLLERKALAANGTFKGDSQAYYLALTVEPLYTSPLAPVAVVLPERLKLVAPKDAAGKSFDWYRGWNACLDKVKELNQ
jgi:hypothetical protein